MARLSSRELALERRKALTTSGKKSSAAAATGANRVRTAADARPTRTNANPADTPAVPTPTASVAVAPQRPVAPHRTVSFSSGAPAHSPLVKAQKSPSRELVLARREALSRRGKTADTSRDRNRADVARHSKPSASSASTVDKKSCGCGGKRAAEQAALSSKTPQLSLRIDRAPSSGDRRSAAPKRRAIENPSRALTPPDGWPCPNTARPLVSNPRVLRPWRVKRIQISPAVSWLNKCMSCAPKQVRATSKVPV